MSGLRSDVNPLAGGERVALAAAAASVPVRGFVGLLDAA